MKKIFLFILFTTLLIAQPKDSTLNGKILLGGDLGVTFTSSDYSDIGSGFILRGVGEYILFDENRHIIGIRGYGAYGISSGSDNRFVPGEFSTNLYMLAAGGIYSYRFSDVVSPYAFLGLRFLRFNPTDPDGNSLPNYANGQYDKNLFNIALEFGLRYKFNDNLYGYSSLTPVSLTNDNIDDKASGNADDFVVALNFGLLYAFNAPWNSSSEAVVEDQMPVGIEESKVEKEEAQAEEIHEIEGEAKEVLEETAEEKLIEEEVIENAEETTPESADTEVEPTGANIIKELSSKLEKGVVHFDFGETELDRMEYVELDRLYSLISDSDKRWKIIGHTDNIEPKEIHQSLAIQRAYFVMRYFMGKGIDREKFEVLVEGTEDPVADNSTPEGRAENRRVEIVKIK